MSTPKLNPYRRINVKRMTDDGRIVRECFNGSIQDIGRLLGEQEGIVLEITFASKESVEQENM